MNEREASELVSDLHDSLYSPLLRYATHKCGSLELAEDIVQEAFTRLYQGLRRGNRIENPKAWAFCVVRREIGARRREASMLGLREPLERLDDLAPFHAKALDPARGDEVGRLLSFLSPREAEVLVLRLGNLKYREIGTELGISGKSVGTLLARALKKLRHALIGKTEGKLATGYVEAESAKPLQ